VLATFDFALPEMSSPQRFESIVPTQALFLMNSPFVIEHARKLAALPALAKAPDDEQRIRLLYRRLYQRPPGKEDIADARAFISQQTDYKPEPPPKPDWQYGLIRKSPDGRPRFFEAKRFANNEWQTSDGAIPVKITETGGRTGTIGASVRRWVAPADGFADIEGTVAATTKDSKAGVRAVIELRRANEATRELGAWPAAKAGVATNLRRIEVRKGDALDFAVFPAGKVPESYSWAPFLRLTAPDGSTPEKHEWNAQSEFAGPPPPPPKGMTAWEKFAQALLLTNEFVYVN
jgi:hypothetical protein